MGGMGRKFICFTSLMCVVGMLTTVGLKATDGAEVDYGREWSPYVTLRGGWLFGGDAKGDVTVTGHPEDNGSLKENITNAWSGSGEFGVSCFEDRVLVGLELGYFTGKATFEFQSGADRVKFPAEFGNTFGACNATLRHYFGERAFWYGGVGVGVVRVFVTADMLTGDGTKAGCGAKSWNFLGQGFTGFGWCLNDNWQLTIGYRLRYLSGNTTWSAGSDVDGMELKMKQDLSHAAEIGVVWRW